MYSIRHNKRKKAMMMSMMCAALPGPSDGESTAEPLSAARSLLQVSAEEPDQPMEFLLPKDTSSQAVTHRGPAVTSVTSAPATSTSGPGTAAPDTATPAMPRTTAWQWKGREEQHRRAQEESAMVLQAPKMFVCKRCGWPKT